MGIPSTVDSVGAKYALPAYSLIQYLYSHHYITIDATYSFFFLFLINFTRFCLHIAVTSTYTIYDVIA